MVGGQVHPDGVGRRIDEDLLSSGLKSPFYVDER
jgi:orotate phosphoribosyltransferase